MWTNYHTHTSFCDGTDEIPALVQHAIKTGLMSLGISSHAPLPFETKWSMKTGDFDAYLDIIRKEARHSPIQLYAGLEVDYIPGIVGPADFESRLDYTIGSVHFVGQFNSGIHWEIDGPHDLFMKGLREIFDNNIRNCVTRYFELTREMIETSAPDILGHFDKVKMHNRFTPLFDEHESWYREEVLKTIDAIENSTMIVEVNTRGLYTKKSNSLYPSIWILEELHRRQIPVTISSDAHHHKDLINLFPAAAATLLSVGFKKIHILDNGLWKPVTLTPDGINP